MAVLSECPNCELAVLIAYTVKTVVMAQKKQRQVSLVDQNDAPCVVHVWRMCTREMRRDQERW